MNQKTKNRKPGFIRYIICSKTIKSNQQ